MPGPAHGRLRQQVDTLRREFLQEGELPFADVLSPGCLAETLAEIRRPCLPARQERVGAGS